MPSKVYFIDFRASVQHNFMAKLSQLLDSAGLTRLVASRDLVAIKLHFGEMGNTAFIRPVYMRGMVAAIKAAGGCPFSPMPIPSMPARAVIPSTT